MTPFDRREALRYMGVRGAPDAGVQALVEFMEKFEKNN